MGEVHELVSRLLQSAARVGAYHEAAHAVVAALVGGIVRQATIVPRMVDGEVVDARITWTPPESLGLRERALVALAGSAATGRNGCARDDAEVRALADQLIEQWRAEATELVEQNADKVQVVAAALLEHGTLDEAQLREILNRET